MIGFIGAALQLHLIKIIYNSTYSVSAQGTFRFLPGLRASSLPLWLAN
jgi:hypothetical protein